MMFGGDMQSREAVRRKMLTYALVSQNFSGRKDPVAALYPLFAPIASDLSGQKFDATQFREELKSRYGVSTTRDVADLFSQRLGQLGLVQTVNGVAVWNASAIATHNIVSSDESALDKLISDAEEFRNTLHDLVSEPLSEEQLLSAIMRIVLDSQQVVQSAVSAVNGASSSDDEAGIRIRDPAEYFASKFISWSKTSKKETFSWISSLSGAALVAEALVELRSPSLPASVNPDLNLYLDTPFLMELLGCSGKASREDARYIYEQLKSQRIRVSVLSHSIDELRYNLKGVLKADPAKRTGPSAIALLYGEVSETYLSEVLDDPEYYVKNIGLDIVRVTGLDVNQNDAHFTKEDEHLYFSGIQSFYNHPQAALRDAASVSWIMRRRRGDRTRDVLKCKQALLTRNQLVYRQINRFCLEKNYISKDQVGPVILARDLAGVLWFLSGSVERAEISQRQLLLNCQRARNNAPQVVSAIVDTLREVSAESAELFMLAVNRPAYLSIALDTVAGSGNGVTRTISETSLEKIREDLIAEERKISKANLEKTKDKFERDSNLKEVVINALNQEKSEIAAINQADKQSWANLSAREWKSIELSSIYFWVISVGVANLILTILAIAGVYVGSDVVKIEPNTKFGVGSVLVVIVAISGYILSKDPLKNLSERRGQKKYDRWVELSIPPHQRGGAKISSPMIDLSYWRAFERLIGRQRS
jgi:hypothetical protein